MDRDIKLIVKAPNQKIDDQVITCSLDWSVLKLKEHLSATYPCKPSVEDQRLIYSGYLLKNEQRLDDILESSEDNTYTLHLVCRQRLSENPKPRTQTTAMTERSGSEGNSEASTPHGNGNNAFLGYGSPWSNVMNAQLSAIPTTPMALNPEQMMQQMAVMQQMYLQYMAQYFNQAGANSQATPFLQQFAAHNFSSGAGPIPTATTPTPGPQQQPPPPPQQQQQPQVQRAAAPIGADDDDDQHNNDWLEWIYWMSRSLIFLSILYFYSSLSRFVVVIGFGMLFYLYQNGFFNARRNEPRQNRNREQGNDLNDAQRMQEMMDGDYDGHRQRNAQAETGPTEERFGVLRMIWILVSSLFTSLIPEQPAPANLN